MNTKKWSEMTVMWVTYDSEGNPLGCCPQDVPNSVKWVRASVADVLYEALLTVVENAPEPYCAITRAIDAQCRAALAKVRGSD